MEFNASQSVISRFFSPWKKTSHKQNPIKNQNWAFPEELCRRFSLAEIIEATEGFNEKLHIGTGAFATVYTGSIIHGATYTLVGIKRLSRNNSLQTVSAAFKKEVVLLCKSLSLNSSLETVSAAFKKEVMLFCQLRHPNLVSFIGYCEEEGEYILVYEYMPNGALSDHLFNMTRVSDPLSWKQRLNICVGAARAIHYLHTGIKHAVMHRDVKSFNILLDENFEAKLSAFALSKMGPPNLSNALIKLDSRVAGTIGYLDPEYMKSGQLTEKSDVFSFGMVLFEVLCAKLAREFPTIRGTLFDIIDPFLIGKIAPDSLKIFMEIAERCVRSVGTERPTMGEVQVELERALELQESADVSKVLGTTSLSSSTSANDYIYRGLTFPSMNDVFRFAQDESI